MRGATGSTTGIVTAGRATGVRGRWGSYPNKEKGRFNVDNEIQDQADFAQN